MSELTAGGRYSKEEKYLGKHIMICIPAFNEAKNIKKIVENAKEIGSEVIVYDDGSTDETCKIAESSGAVVIKSKVNRGYGSAIRELFKAAKRRNADIMVTIDSDGQHDPKEIPLLLNPILNDECDVVIGSRYLSLSSSSAVPRYRDFGIRVITRITRAASYSEITDAQSGFRAYNKEAISSISLYQNGMSVSTEILLRAKENDLRIREVPVKINYNVERSSTSNPVFHGLGVLTSLIQHISLRRPLLFYGVPGLALLVCAAYFTSIALELFSSTRYVSTNLIIVSIGLALIGIVLLATGAIVYTLIAVLRGNLAERR